jgi:hypothetical protein
LRIDFGVRVFEPKESVMRSALVIGAAAPLLVTGCQTVDTTKTSAVGVDRKQHFLISSEQVNASADEAYKQVLADAQKKGALDRDAATLQRVKTIVGRLTPVTGVLRPDCAWLEMGSACPRKPRSTSRSWRRSHQGPVGAHRKSGTAVPGVE